jgi:hyperosmotically inducible periplasmic protein
MNKQAVVLLCSSSLFVACGGSDNNRPAQSAYDPQTTSTNAEMPAATTPSPAPQAPTSPTADPMAPSTMGTATPSQPSPSTDTSGAMGSGWGTGSSNAGASTGSSGSNTGSSSNSAATPPATGSSSATTGTASGTSPDNSGVNKRDRHGGAVTPMDQGTSDGERRITANIRKLVVADKALSFTAKNVKIITVGTKVTLRGPVKSDQEKTAIEGYARGIAGVTEVDDQLEVKK